MGLSVSSTLFLNRLFVLLVANPLTADIQASAVVATGAANLSDLALLGREDVLEALREVYACSVDNPLMFSLVAACVAVPIAAGMDWLNVKVVAKECAVIAARLQDAKDRANCYCKEDRPKTYRALKTKGLAQTFNVFHSSAV